MYILKYINMLYINILTHRRRYYIMLKRIWISVSKNAYELKCGRGLYGIQKNKGFSGSVGFVSAVLARGGGEIRLLSAGNAVTAPR